MSTFPIWFEDLQQTREIEPVRWQAGKELRGGGFVVERSAATPVFDVPGYVVVLDEMAGRLVARRV